MVGRATLLVLVGCVALATDGAASDWPAFRGPGGNGLTTETGLPTDWSGENNLQWKIDVPGEGWSAPIVAGGKVFLTTAVTEGEEGQDSVHRFEVHCYDLATGELLWNRVARQEKPRTETHRANTYASETPVTDGQRVVAYFGMTGVFCYDLQGDLLWQKDLGAYQMQGGWGTASSPTMHGGLVFLQIDCEADSFLVALDAASGDEKWRVPRQEKSNWCSPTIWENVGRTELVTSGSKVRSYDPATGELLWELSLGGGGVSASPAGHDRLLLVGAQERGGGRRGRRGRGSDRDGDHPAREESNAGPGGGLFAVRAGASGDITPSGDSGNEGVAWVNRQAGPVMASPLLYDRHVYVCGRSGGIVGCYHADTGEEMYRERLPGTEQMWASPWAYDGKIFCQDASGATHVLAAGPEFKLLDTNQLEGTFWASSALSDGAIVLRSEAALFCVANPEQSVK